MLHRLRESGFSARVFEAGSGVGGTWYWNRYPGARCDVESVQYSYQFSDELQQEWEWSERYAAQPEILRYANHVADRFDLRRDIQFDTRVTAATLRRGGSRWMIETDGGDARRRRAFCIMATGCLSSPNTPRVRGPRDVSRARRYHTGNWPHEGVDFTGKRVGVIGTGSSAVQSIPIIAAQARQLYRVPAHAELRHAGAQRAARSGVSQRRSRRTIRRCARAPAKTHDRHRLRLQRRRRRWRRPPRSATREYERRWQRGGLSFLGAFSDLMVDQRGQRHRGRVRARQDPRDGGGSRASPTLLSPEEHHRLQAAVHRHRLLRDLQPAQRDAGRCERRRRSSASRRQGVRVPRARTTRSMPSCFATGFDAMTGALIKDRHPRPRAASRCTEKWSEGPRTYLGVAMAGFPEPFTITGPGSPSVLTNMLPTIEQHVEWIADCLAYARAHHISRVEPTREAEDAWVTHVNEIAAALPLNPVCLPLEWRLGAARLCPVLVCEAVVGFPPQPCSSACGLAPAQGALRTQLVYTVLEILLCKTALAYFGVL